jgi:hypothetical protein
VTTLQCQQLQHIGSSLHNNSACNKGASQQQHGAVRSHLHKEHSGARHDTSRNTAGIYAWHLSAHILERHHQGAAAAAAATHALHWHETHNIAVLLQRFHATQLGHFVC